MRGARRRCVPLRFAAAALLPSSNTTARSGATVSYIIPVRSHQAPSLESLYEVAGVYRSRSVRLLTGFVREGEHAARIAALSPLLAYPDDPLFADAGKLPHMLVANVMLPVHASAGVFGSLRSSFSLLSPSRRASQAAADTKRLMSSNHVIVWRLRPSTARACAGVGTASPAVQLFSKWQQEEAADATMRGRFKLILSILNTDAIDFLPKEARAAMEKVNGKPILIKTPVVSYGALAPDVVAAAGTVAAAGAGTATGAAGVAAEAVGDAASASEGGEFSFIYRYI